MGTGMGVDWPTVVCDIQTRAIIALVTLRCFGDGVSYLFPQPCGAGAPFVELTRFEFGAPDKALHLRGISVGPVSELPEKASHGFRIRPLRVMLEVLAVVVDVAELCPSVFLSEELIEYFAVGELRGTWRTFRRVVGGVAPEFAVELFYEVLIRRGH